MNNSRRNFIKSTGISTFGAGLMPSFGSLADIFHLNNSQALLRTSPESQGVSSAGISQFVAAANASGLGWHSFMLLRHGSVIAEAWWKPFEPSFKHTLYSLSKSFTSTAIGLLVKEGKLNVEDSVLSFFAEDAPATPDSNLLKMKVKHLLTMNTGHGEDTTGKMRASKDTWTKAFLALPVNFEPGTHFLYNTGATYMLGAIVHKITGQTLTEYLGPRLFDPLDIKGYDWETSPQGLNTAGYGLRVKTEDIAKFGQMYLQKGKWNGKEILTEAWVNDATRYQTSSQEGNGDWAQGYGYQFWRCKPGFYRGDGAFGQFCIVMPQHDAVLAITSESFNMQQSMTTVWENLLPAIKTDNLPKNISAWQALKKDLLLLSLPVTKSSTSSSLAAKYDSKKIKMESNEFGVNEIQFKFSKEGCSIITNGSKGTGTMKFGWENWWVNKETVPYVFVLPGRFHMPSKMAGTATWINENTLQLNARFVEAMHGDKITCSFEGDKVSIAFLNSVSESSKTDAEKRKGITGVI